MFSGALFHNLDDEYMKLLLEAVEIPVITRDKTISLKHKLIVSGNWIPEFFSLFCFIYPHEFVFFKVKKQIDSYKFRGK